MLEILGVTTPVFVLIAIGYFSVKTNTIPKAAIAGMGLYVIYCALPAMLIQSLSGLAITDIFNTHYLGVWGSASIVVYTLSFLVSRRLRNKNRCDSAFQGLGAALPNSAFIGYALLTPLFGTTAVIGVALSMLFDLVVTIPTTVALSESAQKKNAKVLAVIAHALVNTIKNPLVIAIVIGILISLLEVSPPTPITKVISMLASSAAAVSLFVIGGALAGCSLHGKAADILQLSTFKLIVQPLAVTLAILILPDFDPQLQVTAILLAAMPMAGVFPIIGQRYGQEELCATSLVIATLASFATINVIMWILSENHLLP